MSGEHAEGGLAQTKCREGEALIAQNCLDDARTLLTESIEIDPDRSDAYTSLGVISCKQVRSDIQSSIRWLRPGGIICGHDYWPDSPGVIKAVNELLFSRPDVWEFGAVGGDSSIWFVRFDTDLPPG